MSNPFKYSDDNKRYLTQNYYLRKRFGCKVIKISLNGGFTCPNIDGTKGFGGCTYCSSKGSGDFAGNPNESITQQFNEIKEMMNHKWQGKYIAYFQANTNTYGPLSKIKAMCEEALSIDNVVGISLATRADCLENDVVEYLADLNKRTYLTVELGLQTIHDKTAEYINRCHSYEEFLSGYNKLVNKGLNVCIHVINGLPFETHDMMLETAKEVARLHPHSVKFHLLHIIKGTRMAEQFLLSEFQELSLRSYVNIICDQLEIMPQDVIIQRVTGDGEKESLIAPLWSLKKFVVMNEIDKEMVRRNSFQGISIK